MSYHDLDVGDKEKKTKEGETSPRAEEEPITVPSGTAAELLDLLRIKWVIFSFQLSFTLKLGMVGWCNASSKRTR